MSETLPSLTANGQKLIDRLLTLPQGWVTAAMLAESIGVSRRTVLRELPSVEQWIAAAGYHFVRSPSPRAHWPPIWTKSGSGYPRMR